VIVISSMRGEIALLVMVSKVVLSTFLHFYVQLSSIVH